MLKLNIFLWRILIDLQILYSEATENPSRSVTSKEWLGDQKANSKERLRADASLMKPANI